MNLSVSKDLTNMKSVYFGDQIINPLYNVCNTLFTFAVVVYACMKFSR